MLREAHRRISAWDGTEMLRPSSLYRTRPVGVLDQPEFLNAVFHLRCNLQPEDLLDKLLALETELGRVRTLRWGPRLIDLDLLLFGARIISKPDLCVPHPRLCERGFVLAPMAELAPELLHPANGVRIRELLVAWEDGQTDAALAVQRIEPFREDK